eukprot:6272306-Prymnesium_polylepis.1
MRARTSALGGWLAVTVGRVVGYLSTSMSAARRCACGARRAGGRSHSHFVCRMATRPHKQCPRALRHVR